jgi:NADH-quinone oxidoreductase subunit A
VSDFLRNYLTVAIFGAFAAVLVGAVMGLGALIRPVRRSEQKSMTYESGVDPVGDMWSQSNVRYYVFALLFVLFDVEAVFIFPWATRLELYDVFGLIEMGIFIAILALGLVYAWRKGMLRWA